jgi:hypothetical protein
MRVGCIEKFLKMIFGWSCLALEVACSCCYTLLAGVTDFLITPGVVSYYGDTMGSLLLPFSYHPWRLSWRP